MNQITIAETAILVKLLKKLEPGFLPLAVFNEVARLVRLTAVNLIPIRYIQGELEVAIFRRPKDDLWWPNMWNLPGTIFRSTDTIQSAQNRLLNEEMKIESSDPAVFRLFLPQIIKRGSGICLIYTIANCKFTRVSPMKWFGINGLPDDMVDSEIEVVRELEKVLQT